GNAIMVLLSIVIIGLAVFFIVKYWPDKKVEPASTGTGVPPSYMTEDLQAILLDLQRNQFNEFDQRRIVEAYLKTKNEKDPNFPLLESYLNGLIDLLQEEYESSMEHFEKALASPEYTSQESLRALLMLACSNVCKKQNNLEQERYWLNEALKWTQEHALVRDEIAVHLTLQQTNYNRFVASGDQSELMTAFRIMEEHQVFDQNTVLGVVDVLNILGDSVHAREVYDKYAGQYITDINRPQGVFYFIHQLKKASDNQEWALVDSLLKVVDVSFLSNQVRWLFIRCYLLKVDFFAEQIGQEEFKKFIPYLENSFPQIVPKLAD